MALRARGAHGGDSGLMTNAVTFVVTSKGEIDELCPVLPLAPRIKSRMRASHKMDRTAPSCVTGKQVDLRTRSRTTR